MTICIVDTSVLCNVLNVPGRNDHRDVTLRTLGEYLERQFTLLLPLAAVYETGTHIAHLPDGRLRRRSAHRFADEVTRAVRGSAPWTPTPLPDGQILLEWLNDFPDAAMRGLSLADHSIVKEFDRQCALHRARRVLVWSLDAQLRAYDRPGA